MTDRFGKWKEGLERTRKMAFGRIVNIIGASEIDEASWDDL
jgi:fused signal recognition particle receptor